MVRVSTQITAARMAARRAVNPSRSSFCCSTEAAMARRIGSVSPWPTDSACSRSPLGRDSRALILTGRERPRPEAPGRDAGPTALRVARLPSPRSLSLSGLRVYPVRRTSEGEIARVTGRVAEGFFDAHQLVVLGHPLTARRRTGLDLAAAHGNR